MLWHAWRLHACLHLKSIRDSKMATSKLLLRFFPLILFYVIFSLSIIFLIFVCSVCFHYFTYYNKNKDCFQFLTYFVFSHFFLLMKSITHDRSQQKKVMSRPHLEFSFSSLICNRHVLKNITENLEFLNVSLL